jgi:hypothetical protein
METITRAFEAKNGLVEGVHAAESYWNSGAFSR